MHLTYFKCYLNYKTCLFWKYKGIREGSGPKHIEDPVQNIVLYKTLFQCYLDKNQKLSGKFKGLKFWIREGNGLKNVGDPVQNIVLLKTLLCLHFLGNNG